MAMIPPRIPNGAGLPDVVAAVQQLQDQVARNTEALRTLLALTEDAVLEGVPSLEALEPEPVRAAEDYTVPEGLPPDLIEMAREAVRATNRRRSTIRGKVDQLQAAKTRLL